MFKKSPPARENSFDQQEQQIRDLLAAGRWRKGRDLAKPLCKSDPKRFLPLLIQANIGLAKEMISNGQLSEAQQVVHYLQSIAPKEQLRSLEMALASKLGKYDQALANGMELLSNPSSTVSPSEKRSTADRIVICYLSPSPSVSSAVPPLAKEAEAIIAALQAVSESKFTSAAEMLLPISAASPFSHWKVFIKGVIAFHLGEHTKAGKFFAAVEPDTVPGRARTLYQLWMSKEPVRKNVPMESHTLDAFCLLAGNPVSSGLLLKAEDLWRQGKLIELYRTLREALPDFPTSQPTWVGALSDFCLSVFTTLRASQKSAFLDFLDELVAYGKTRNDTEKVLLLRILCLLSNLGSSHHADISEWESYLDLHQKIYGEDPKFRSLAYAWIASALIFPGNSIKAIPALELSPPKVSPAKARKAIALFKTSIGLDPSNLEAHLGLATVYKLLKMDKELHRLFETMTASFPQDKRVLTQATRLCIDRAAYSQALNFITRAMEIDPLDASLGDLCVRIQMILARGYYQQKQTEKGRQIFEQLQENPIILDQPNNFDRSRWALLVRRGVQEKLYGNAEEAKKWFHQGYLLCPVIAASDFLADIVYRISVGIEKKKISKTTNEFAASFRAKIKGKATAAQAAFLVRLYQHFESIGAGPCLLTAGDLIGSCIKEACLYPCTREELLRLIDSIQNLKQGRDFGIGKLIQKVLKGDPKDPLLQYHQLRIDSKVYLSAAARRKKLEKMLQEATRRKDVHTQQLIQRELDATRRLEPMPVPREELDDEFWEEDVEEDLGSMSDDFPKGDFFDAIEDFDPNPAADSPLKQALAREFFSAMYQEERPLLEAMIDTLQNIHPSEMARTRKYMTQGMPDFVFEFLLKTVRRPNFQISMLLSKPGSSPFSGPRPISGGKKSPPEKKPEKAKPTPKYTHKTLF